MNAFGLFAAVDIGIIIKILVIALVVLSSVVGKILTSMRGPQRPAGPMRPPVIPPQQPRQGQQPQAQAARPKSVKEEIDEFLSRAAQKKQGQATPADPTRRISQPMSPLAQREDPTRRISQPTAPLAQRVGPVEAEVVRERPVGGAVSAHVKKYLDEKEFDQRASKLGGEVAAADTKIEQHLQQVFGHGISKLAAKPGETAAPPTPQTAGIFQDEPAALPAAGLGLAALLNNIDNLRQAIVINEILKRPSDRWK
jgi:hypothetical protein